jgi:hypothetical protein
MLSSCGLLCEGCYAFGKDCPGCDRIEGKPSWADEIGIGTCELYQCARDRGITSCGSCAALPCRQFVELRDPSLGMESHLANVNKRVGRLRAASEAATLAVSIRTRDSFCVVGYALDTSLTAPEQRSLGSGRGFSRAEVLRSLAILPMKRREGARMVFAPGLIAAQAVFRT